MGVDADFVRAERYREYLRSIEEVARPGSPRGLSSSERDEADDRPRERAERTQDRTRGPRLFFNGAGVLWGDIRTIGLEGKSGRVWPVGTETGLLLEETSLRVKCAQAIRIRVQQL